MSESAPAIAPDSKDWTWVLREPCRECGFDAGAVDREGVGRLIRDDAAGWAAILTLPEIARRTDPQTWSPLEYACHVRDVNRIMGRRVRQLLDHDEPTFDNWDQDATALAEAYHRQDPAVVAREVVEAAEEVAVRYDALIGAPETTWDRRGRRSNGSEFTVDSLARYHLHDLVHHAHDVRSHAARVTAASYDVSAAQFTAATAQIGDDARRWLSRFGEAVGASGAGLLDGAGRVLEIGSGGGRDAAALEGLGLRVRRTDISSGFVEAMRGRGLEADVVDPLHDELGGPYDGVWASACLLHVARGDVSVVLRRLAQATRPGGALGMSLKQGDGEGWSTHGTVTSPRHFVYWREPALREALASAGWRVRDLTVEHSPYNTQPWLVVLARRDD